MRVGVPKEIKTDEFRVGLTPQSVAEFVRKGHEVVVESGAGLGIFADDGVYAEAGARIASSAAEVFEVADMIVKVKEPQPVECGMLRAGQILYTYLHLAADRRQTEALLGSGCTAIAYETVTDRNGGLPLLTPMSEIAGRLAIQAGARSLERPQGGRGVLLGGVPGVAPGNVVIIGGGVVGTQAMRMAVGLGADVTILDRSLARLRALDDLFTGRVKTRYSTRQSIAELIVDADLVIGAVLVPGATAPRLIERSMLSTMKEGSVLVDVAIDQGGCFETSKATTHREPTYIVDHVIHYCVANMPGAVPMTSSYALGNATLPYGLLLAERGLDALKDPHLLAGLNVHQGSLTSEAVADSLGMQYTAPSF